MRVLLADINHPVLHESLQAAGFHCDLFWHKPVEELVAILPEYEVLVLRSRFRITKEILEQARKLKCIGRVGAGMENIDVKAASDRGIKCLCVPEGNRDAVGEHVLGMLLMLFNNLKRADAEVRQGIWKRAENRGIEIGGKTVALIGYGNMGTAVAEKLHGFGCTVLAYDKYRRNYGDAYAREAGMDEIFREADIVSLHVPLTSETRHLADAGFFSSFQKKIWFVNTARGPCVHTQHLVQALQDGKVLGACLDVLEYESVSFEKIDLSPAPLHYLVNASNVILTPHIAGWTHESNYKMSKGIAQKIIDSLKN